MKTYFKLIEEHGKLIQVCSLCKKYRSPVVKENCKDLPCNGLKIHLYKTHNIRI